MNFARGVRKRRRPTRSNRDPARCEDLELRRACMSRLLDQVPEVEPEAAAELASAEVRRLPAGSTHGVDAFRDLSFLVVEEGFVVIRREFSGRRGVVVCHAGQCFELLAAVTG